MKNKKQEKAKEEYYLGTNEKNEKIIKKVNLETNQEINIIFDTSDQKTLVKQILKAENITWLFQNNMVKW